MRVHEWLTSAEEVAEAERRVFEAKAAGDRHARIDQVLTFAALSALVLFAVLLGVLLATPARGF